MDHQYDNRQVYSSPRHEKRHRGSFLGTVLVIIGLLWILKEIGWQIGLPGWEEVSHAASSFLNIFHIHSWSVSFPVVILIVGLLLISGRRVIGTILIVLAVLFFLPHLIIPGILAIIFFPVLLIVLGIILIARFL